MEATVGGSLTGFLRRAGLLVFSRLLFAAVCLLTSFYCLLAFVPFTYLHFLQFEHFGWLAFFVRFHPLLFLGSLALVAATLIEVLGRLRAQRRALLFMLASLVLGVYLVIDPLLGRLQNDSSSLVWSALWMCPLWILARVDAAACWRDGARWEQSLGDGISVRFAAACESAAFLTALNLAVAYARFREAALEAWMAEAASITFRYFVLFMALFAGLELLNSLSALFREPPKVLFVLLNVALTGALFVVLRRLVFRSFSFDGPASVVFAFGFSATVVTYGIALKWRWRSALEGPVSDGLSLFLAPLSRGSLATPALRVVALLALSAVTFSLATYLAPRDWNLTLQKLADLALWLVTYGLFHAMAGHRGQAHEEPTMAKIVLQRRSTLFLSFAAVFALLFVLLPRGSSAYSEYDTSYALLRDFGRPAPPDPAFYAYLDANTSIPRSVPIEPVETKLVERWVAGALPGKPHIFMIVVDSLRKDYLSPYNDAVAFTPEIAEFAAGSTVFDNAFTHYGGTGLAEPSIWVGGMLVSQQYVEPFEPMNALQKLLLLEGYDSFLSLDSVLKAIVSPSLAFTQIEETSDRNFDLCSSLESLSHRLASRQDEEAPIFAYTQPQNLHISVINRAGAGSIDGESYEGFHAPYASRIRRLDRCLGVFLDRLRELGLFRNSIIILTSDHGDSLGEAGRWGHAYTIFPEVLRIPMIVHLPEEMAQAYEASTHLVSFSSDLTPTLYYLLGHRPILVAPLLGRPLFTQTLEELAPYRQRDFLVASSYGPVWGILRDNGSRLFISDAVNFADHLFDLEGDRELQLTNPVREDYRSQVRQRIETIRQLYRLDERRDSPAAQLSVERRD